MGDVPVDVHGGRHTVLRHILVVAGARLTIHAVDTGDGDPLVAPSDVPAMGGVSAPGEPSSLPHMRCPDTGRSSPAHRLLHRGGPVRGRIPQSLAHLQGAPHLRVEAGTLQGRLPLLVLQGDIRVPGQEEAAQGARRRTLSPSVQDSTTRCTQHAHPVQTGPAACSQTAQPSARRLQPPRRHSLLPTSTVLHGKSTETRDGI